MGAGKEASRLNNIVFSENIRWLYFKLRIKDRILPCQFGIKISSKFSQILPTVQTKRTKWIMCLFITIGTFVVSGFFTQI